MEKEQKKSKIGLKNSTRQQFTLKLLVVIVLILLQAIMIFWLYAKMRQYVLYWQTIALFVSTVVVLYLVNKQDNPAYTLIWVILIMSFPFAGGVFYLVLAGNKTRKKFIKDCLENHQDTFQYLPENSDVLAEIEEKSKSARVQSGYIAKTAGYPIYKDTEAVYFRLGEDNYRSLVAELKNAKRFIFMEYFIIKQGEMWSAILDILKEKAAAGVDVRLIYDDLGCAMWMPSRFLREMKAAGIKAVPFNKLIPVINLRQNNRDHRKITVIDGDIGFTGGINLADEYINIGSRYGHWKDTGIMLKGPAVWNLTVMFLQTWNMLTKEFEDYNMYAPSAVSSSGCEGYVQPYGDTPVDDEIVGENIYLNMINKAKKYVYITTPYLIIDHEMYTALTLAAKSGIDVRIITPGIPDKKLVYMVTQSYYYDLINNGVRIFQYTPGFIHAKTVVMDDNIATVGTINFDYRSLYLHFECGVWLYGGDVIDDIRSDYMDTLEKCDEITLEEIVKNTGSLKRVKQSLLRLIAPLL